MITLPVLLLILIIVLLLGGYFGRGYIGPFGGNALYVVALVVLVVLALKYFHVI